MRSRPARAESAWRRPAILRAFDEEYRAATQLELFFDLCFVVAVAALARDLHSDPTMPGVLRFTGLFVLVWWAWMGFTWYATAFDNDDGVYRVTLLTAMLGIVSVAANVGGIVNGASSGFVVSYAALHLLLVGLYVRARRHETAARDFSSRYAVGNSLGASLWLLSLLAPEPARYGVWALALIVEISTQVFAYRAITTRAFNAFHVTERYGLFTIIVLGESVFAVAAGITDIDWRAASVVTGFCGFVIAACIWWTYFDHMESKALSLGTGGAFFWGYGHLFIYGGIAAAGVGIELAIESVAESAPTDAHGNAEGDAHGELSEGARGILCGGVAVYLLATSAIRSFTRWSVRDEVLAARLGAVSGILVLVLVGVGLSPPVFVALLALMLVGLTVFEIERSGRPVDSPSESIT